MSSSAIVEVCLRPESTAQPDAVKAHINQLLAQHGAPLRAGEELDCSADAGLAAHVRRIRVAEASSSSAAAPPHVLVHRLYDEEPAEETAAGGGGGDDEAVAFQNWLLPAVEFDGLWETLVFEEEIKGRLLRYVSTAMRFAELGVDGNVIAWNRVVLLHGPPGTGKTSLCKALAQKLAIRLSGTYAQGQLVEVNAHSLFSKWFSESGKMVMGLFARIREILDDGDAFVCVLIDEVESLTAARKAALGGSEPSDAVRVVNALLTQIDALRRYKNALVLTTSNLTGAIDAAFVDRADIKQYIGPPRVAARYQILASCAHELRRAAVLGDFGDLLPHASVAPLLGATPPTFAQVAALRVEGASASAPRHSMMLERVAELCDGLSGRALRKLPFLAHAMFAPEGLADEPLPLDAFLDALHRAVQHEGEARAELDSM